MRAAAYMAPEQIELVESGEPSAGAGQVVVAVAVAGICGSDMHSYRSGFAARPGQVLGHEFSGVVAQAAAVDGIAVGDRVTVRPLIPCGECTACRRGEVQLCEAGLGANIGYGQPGAFAERVLVPRARLGETIFMLPDGVSDDAGAMVEPLSVALRATRHAAIKPGATAVVIGAGTIGLGAVAFLRLQQAGRIIVLDPSEIRRSAATRLGADVVIDPLGEDAVAAIAAVTGTGAHGRGARADVTLDCSGAPGTFVTAIDATEQGGTVVVASMGAAKSELRTDRFVAKELTIRGSMAYRDEFPIVIGHLERDEIDIDAFISHRMPLGSVADAFRVQADAAQSLKVMVVP